MCRNISEINRTLRQYQECWYNRICVPWMRKQPMEQNLREYMAKNFETAEYGFSEPFCSALYEPIQYPLIMFVGQETGPWGKIESFESIEAEQLYCSKKTSDYILLNESTKSIFWKTIRRIRFDHCKRPFDVCWNNLDKIHYRSNDKTDCIRLYSEDETFLNQEVCKGKTLLQIEIETICPDIIVFFTGSRPRYVKSMKTALGVQEFPNGIPSSSSKNVNEIVTCFNYPLVSRKIPCLWTYHPTAISKMKEFKGIRDDIIAYIGARIDDFLKSYATRV